MKKGTTKKKRIAGKPGDISKPLQGFVSSTILDEAKAVVYGDRQEAYGPVNVNFKRIGRIWGALLGIDDIAPATVGLMMAGVKMSRQVHKPKKDNLVDIAGYAATIEKMDSEKADSEYIKIGDFELAYIGNNFKIKNNGRS